MNSKEKKFVVASGLISGSVISLYQFINDATILESNAVVVLIPFFLVLISNCFIIYLFPRQLTRKERISISVYTQVIAGSVYSLIRVLMEEQPETFIRVFSVFVILVLFVLTGIISGFFFSKQRTEEPQNSNSVRENVLDSPLE